MNALSRLPLLDSEDEPSPPGDVFMIETPMGSSLTAAEIARMTQADSTLSPVFEAVQGETLHQLREAIFMPFRKNCLRSEAVSCGAPGLSFQQQ